MKLKLKLRLIIRLWKSHKSLPVRKCVKNSDDHKRYLGGEEYGNNYNQHQGCALGISLLSAFSDSAATGPKETDSIRNCKNRANLPLFFRNDQFFSSLCPPLLVKLEFKVLPLFSRFLLRSLVLRAEQRRMLSTTREMQGRRCTKRTRNLEGLIILLHQTKKNKILTSNLPEEKHEVYIYVDKIGPI